MPFQVSSIDRFGLLRTTRSQQLSAQQMSYRKEPVGGLIVGELILLRDSLLQQVDRLLRFVLRVGDARFSDERADSEYVLRRVEAPGRVGRQFSGKLLKIIDRSLRFRDSPLSGKRRCLCIQLTASERLEPRIWWRFGDHLVPSTEAHQNGVGL